MKLNNICKRLTTLILLCLFHLEVTAQEKPNVLIILTDDLGFSDIGCYGSEIETPHLDKLAANGLRFTQFYNTAKCHSTRVSLLSGRWCIQAGDTSLNRSVTIAEAFKEGGYFTCMTGKWHLNKTPEDFGFDHYFGHLSGATNYFTGDKTYRLDGKPWKVPKEGFYATTANIDFSLKFLERARREKKPWFMYVAFNAPHGPLQPLKEDYEKYLNHYNVGWDVIRDRRFAKQKKLGLFPVELKTAPRPDHVKNWDKMGEYLQTWEKMRMAAYAGLIDRVDQETGRLINDLKENNELDNTIILFLSDNGSCPYDRRPPNIKSKPYTAKVRWSDSTGWAWARNVPFRFYKQNQFEGGITTPFIVHWPAGLKTKAGSINRTPAHLVDIYPTVAQLCGVKIPKEWPDRQVSSMPGVSLAPIFAGKELSKRPPISLKFEKDVGLRDGDWKIVSFRGMPWELYNIKEDRTELNNLAAKYPERVKTMAALWEKITREDLKLTDFYKPAFEGPTEPKTHPQWNKGINSVKKK